METGESAVSSYFSLFGIDECFTLNEKDLLERYNALRERTHPDRNISNINQLVAERLTAQINEAYRTLQDPLLRAAYILNRLGTDPFDERNTTMATDFLEKQIEMREQLDDAIDNKDKIADLLKSTNQLITETTTQLGQAMEQAEGPDITIAVEAVRKLKYLINFSNECAKQV